MLYDDIKHLVKKLVLSLVEIELDRRMDKELGATKPKVRTKSRFEQAIDSVRSRAARKAAVTRRKRKEAMMEEEKKVVEDEATSAEDATETPPVTGEAVEVKTGPDGKTEVWKDGAMLFSRARARDAAREARRRGLLISAPKV